MAESALSTGPGHGPIRLERGRPARRLTRKELHDERDSGRLAGHIRGFGECPRLPRNQSNFHVGPRVEERARCWIICKEGKPSEVGLRRPHIPQDEMDVDLRHANLRGVREHPNVGDAHFDRRTQEQNRPRCDAQDYGRGNCEDKDDAAMLASIDSLEYASSIESYVSPEGEMRTGSGRTAFRGRAMAKKDARAGRNGLTC